MEKNNIPRSVFDHNRYGKIKYKRDLIESEAYKASAYSQLRLEDKLCDPQIQDYVARVCSLAIENRLRSIEKAFKVNAAYQLEAAIIIEPFIKSMAKTHELDKMQMKILLTVGLCNTGELTDKLEGATLPSMAVIFFPEVKMRYLQTKVADMVNRGILKKVYRRRGGKYYYLDTKGAAIIRSLRSQYTSQIHRLEDALINVHEFKP